MAEVDRNALAEALLAEAACLRKLARMLALAPADVDDVVQQTVAVAIEKPPSHMESLRPWLLSVLRNFTFRHRRQAGARAARERLAARAESVPSAADVVERVELQRKIVDAVLGLDAPYRETMLLRFWDDLPPREISQRMGVPVATVHTRLARGLERLRRDLDGSFGSRAAWLSALARLGPGHLWGSWTIVVLLMKMKLVGGAAAALACVAAATLWLSWPSESVASVGVDGSQPRQAALTSESRPTQRSQVESAPAGLAVDPTTQRPSANVAVLLGHIVDGVSGAGVDGIVVRLSISDQRAAPKEVASATTAAGGRFEIAFEPAPKSPFWLLAEPAGYAALAASGQISAGDRADYGDIALERGARVRGRVVDTDGLAQPGVDVYLTRGSTGIRLERGFQSYFHLGKVSDAEGRFALPYALPADTWKVSVGSRAQLERPAAADIPADRDEVVLDVVVKAERDLDVITGLVVDDSGRPVPGLTIEYDLGSEGGRRPLYADGQGRFRHVRDAREPKEPVRYRVPGTEDVLAMRDPRTFTWGTRDLRLIVHRTPGIEVQVVDAETGTPVEEFALRCFPDPTSGGSPDASRSRAEGTHPGGTVRVGVARAGLNYVVVEPADHERFGMPAPVAFEANDSGAPRQVVRVPRLAERTIVVTNANGQPVAGSHVEVLQPLSAGTEISLWTRLASAAELYRASGKSTAIPVHDGVTGANGSVVVQGSAGTALVVRVLGPGHAPCVVPAFTLPGEPFRITVRQGATLVGKITPRDVVALMTMPAEGAMEAKPPGILLMDSSRPPRRFPIGFATTWFRIADEGTFRCEGIEPGSWKVALYWSRRLDDRTTTSGPEVLMTVDALRDGETRTIECDARAIVPGTLSGQVFLDGTPLAGGELWLSGYRTSDPTRLAWNGYRRKTDAQGRFVMQVAGGQCTVDVYLTSKTTGEKVLLRAPERVEVLPGGQSSSTFTLVRRVLSLVLRGADGAPLAGRRVAIMGEALQCNEIVSDAKGRFVLDPAPLLPFTVRVTDGSGTLDLGEVTPPADRREAELVLQVKK